MKDTWACPVCPVAQGQALRGLHALGLFFTTEPHVGLTSCPEGVTSSWEAHLIDLGASPACALRSCRAAQPIQARGFRLARALARHLAQVRATLAAFLSLRWHRILSMEGAWQMLRTFQSENDSLSLLKLDRSFLSTPVSSVRLQRCSQHCCDGGQVPAPLKRDVKSSGSASLDLVICEGTLFPKMRCDMERYLATMPLTRCTDRRGEG